MHKYLNFEEYALYELNKSSLVKGSKGDRLTRSKTVLVDFNGAKFSDKILEVYFKSKDQASKSGKEWEQIVQVLEFSEDGKTKDNLRKAFNGNLKVYCECPDFSYGGFQYIGTVKDYSIYPEELPPNETNPNQEGTVCKHLLGVLTKLDSFINQTYKDITA